jgi:hypothetical protein
MMNTLEKFHIYKLTKLGIQINDKSTATHNILFDTLLRHEWHRWHPVPRHWTYVNRSIKYIRSKELHKQISRLWNQQLKEDRRTSDISTVSSVSIYNEINSSIVRLYSYVYQFQDSATTYNTRIIIFILCTAKHSLTTALLQKINFVTTLDKNQLKRIEESLYIYMYQRQHLTDTSIQHGSKKS